MAAVDAARSLARNAGRHQRRRISQWARWSESVIPALMEPFMGYQQLTHSGRIAPPSINRACLCNKLHLRLTLAQWNELENITLPVCGCQPASIQLMSRGYFPCAPARPSMAFHLDLLDFISIHAHNAAPNTAAWAETLEAFWKERSYILPSDDSLRRRLGTALQWYQVLVHRVRTLVSEVSKAPPPPASAPPLANTSSLGDTPPEANAPPPTSPPPPTIAPLPSASTQPSAGARPPANTPPPKSGPTPGPKALDRPSEYLRSCCPLCFGGARPNLGDSEADIHACLDATFGQKRRTSALDPELHHPSSRFLSAEAVREMEVRVEQARGPKSGNGKGKAKATGNVVADLTISSAILDECERSFLAAQEKVAKASKSFYSDTGLMALLCRHDRVLWLVNVTTPGERQHYAFALLYELFRHLPPTWTVGLLYNIACQLHRSMIKHGILSEFLPRLSFAVSVFHAYGHQWPCQLVYHPRKRVGFGLTNGEGCERFWSALQALIPSLRVSGFHRRLFVIDCRLDHLDTKSLMRLALWISRQYKACRKRLSVATAGLYNSGVPVSELLLEWKAQIATQTQKSPRQSKNLADKAVAEVMLERDMLDEIMVNIKALEDRRAQVHEAGEEARQQLDIQIEKLHISSAQTKARLKVMEKALGVAGKKQLSDLKGNPYLRTRMNAHVLRTRIRAKVVEFKFERTKLERVYRHHLMQEKQHTQTKNSIHRRHNGISALISKFNKLVDQMDSLQRGHKAPINTVSPQKLDVRKIFRLDVDDELWQEDPGLGDEACDKLPRWLGDEKVRNGIVSMLEQDRCLEEIRRLDAECLAMQSWLVDGLKNLETAFSSTQDKPGMQYQLQCRLETHYEINACWRRSLSSIKPDMQWLPENHRAISTEPIVAYSRKYSKTRAASSQDSGAHLSDDSESETESAHDEVDPADEIIDNMEDDDMEIETEVEVPSSASPSNAHDNLPTSNFHREAYTPPPYVDHSSLTTDTTSPKTSTHAHEVVSLPSKTQYGYPLTLHSSEH
ncbi:hypothetical protein BOTBODRAFT_111622 [Botryobasidium botryosum FD-172 SS1]|uniref:CxC1-like cysteine cluster associated with KDZ transposases domain-containing protein n=1 Tax=Botryobasidium botryosum (strain FD-172 SS1) TaxID=930990 RepID=A0A067MP89_BOTB1|nr:hypothetical protein BOTBODRAFT_111622 [Botryobasidium botryosum FD-172 SS1]